MPVALRQIHIEKKKTMIRDRVGMAKESTFNLPNGNFTYGRPRKSDSESAGEILSSWVTSDPSAAKRVENIIVMSNVLAVKNGCITAKTMRQYCIDHPSVRRKEMLIIDSSRGPENRYEGPFGRKTVFSEDGMGEILGAKFTNFDSDDTNYPDTSNIVKTCFMGRPKTTNAHESISRARRNAKLAAESKENNHFCMKRFQNYKAESEYSQKLIKPLKRAQSAGPLRSLSNNNNTYNKEV